MIYYKLLLSITVIAFLLAQADAKPIDPLNPSQLGESMSMPLDQELNHVNVTGAWSFDLLGKAPEKMKLYLIQNKDVIAGQGVINRGNETEKATANGSISGEQMSLNVMPEGVSDLYRLNLSLSSLAAGTYTACMADGSSRSGKVTFAVSANIFKAETVAEDESGADADQQQRRPPGFREPGPKSKILISLGAAQIDSSSVEQYLKELPLNKKNEKGLCSPVT